MSSPHGFRRWRHGSYPCAYAARLTSSGEPSRRRATRPTHLAPDTAHSHRNEGESAMQHHQTLLRSSARSPAASARSSRGCPSPRPGDHPAPVARWTARDVVRHLLDWFPGFLQAGAGTTLPAGPSPDDDSVAAWTTSTVASRRCSTIRRARTAPPPTRTPAACRCRWRSHGSSPPTSSCIPWDLARATGQNETLGPRALRVDARGHGANGGSTARERAVRTARRSPWECRPADSTDRLHRPRPPTSHWARSRLRGRRGHAPHDNTKDPT